MVYVNGVVVPKDRQVPKERETTHEPNPSEEGRNWQNGQQHREALETLQEIVSPGVDSPESLLMCLKEGVKLTLNLCTVSFEELLHCMVLCVYPVSPLI